MFIPQFIRNLFARKHDEFASLMRAFQAVPDPIHKWSIPFPVAVFGTLRFAGGNHPLMGLPVGSKAPDNGDDDGMGWYERRPWTDARYSRVIKAFLPNFTVQGIQVLACPEHAVYFEVFVYDAENWAKAITKIDRLEAFRPQDADHSWYYRTLVNLRVLPDTFDTPGSICQHVHINPSHWEQYPTMPCWIYSSNRENRKSRSFDGSPIIWAGERAREEVLV